MGISKNQLGAAVLLTVLLPAFIAAQCPTSSEVDSIISIQSTGPIEALVFQLSNCDDPEIKSYAFHYAAGRYFKRVDLDRAIRLSEQALDIRQNLEEPDSASIGKTSFNLGLYHTERGDLIEAEYYFLQAVQAFKTVESAFGLAMSRKNLASVYELKGDFEKARAYLESTIQLAEVSGLSSIQADAQVDLGMIYNFLQAPEGGLKSLEAAKSIYEQLEKEGGRYNPANLAACYLNMAFAYDDLEAWEMALGYYQKAQELFDELDRLEMSITCQINVGYTHFKQGNNDLASSKWMEALQRAGQFKRPHLEAMALDNLGDLALANEQCFKAVDYYNSAIEILSPTLNLRESDQNTIRAASNKEHLLNYLTDRGAALFVCYETSGDKSYLTRAIKNYQQADELVDWMRYEHSARGSKLYWREVTRPLFEQALEVCYELQDFEQAFYFMEKSKAILLLDAMRAHHARTLIPAEVEQKERMLQRKLADLRIKQLNAPATERALWLDTILLVQQELDQLVNQIKSTNPVYAVTQYGGAMLGVEEVYEKYVKPLNSGVIQYFLGEENAYSWAMNADGQMQLNQLDAESLDQNLEAYFEAMNKLGKAFYPDQYAVAANKVYDDLFKDVASFLSGDRVLIVPDGKTALLPFEALMESTSFDPGKFLLQQYQVHYAYSLAVLNQQYRTESSGRKIYTFAPLFKNGQRGLAALKDSHSLLDQHHLKSYEKVVGPKATVDQLDQIINNAYIINLITHAVSEGGSVPRIEFSDRSLYLPELYARHIPANLVLLGACQTGIGTLSEGEGVMSLASGFAYAGVASLIGSLWNVREEAGREVLTDFYTNILEGQNKSEALWNAKRNYLMNADKVHANPYFWAAFVYVGADGPLEVETVSYWWMWAIIGIVVILFSWVIARSIVWKSRNREPLLNRKPLISWNNI